MSFSNKNKPDLLKIFTVTDSKLLRESLKIRMNVFVLEQGCPEDEEIDDYDFQPWLNSTSTHFVAKLNDLYIGTARIIFSQTKDSSTSPLIQRVAIIKEFRGNNYGYHIMQKIHDFLIERKFKTAELSAQVYAIKFYEKLGYKSYGDIYYDAGIEHKTMKIKF